MRRKLAGLSSAVLFNFYNKANATHLYGDGVNGCDVGILIELKKQSSL